MLNQQNNNKNPVFPEGSGLIIYGLLKKYGLEEIQKKKVQKMIKTEDHEEREKIAEELPGRKIAGIIKRAAEGKIPAVSLASELKEQLNLTNSIAENLAKELKENLLKQKEEAETRGGDPPKHQKPDIYRESIK